MALTQHNQHPHVILLSEVADILAMAAENVEQAPRYAAEILSRRRSAIGLYLKQEQPHHQPQLTARRRGTKRQLSQGMQSLASLIRTDIVPGVEHDDCADKAGRAALELVMSEIDAFLSYRRLHDALRTAAC